MTESQIQELFSQIADGEPDSPRVDTKLVLHRGRSRLRWRRAGLIGAPALAAGLVVAVVLAVAAAPMRSGTGQPATGAKATAPRQFNPLSPGVAFGWLPTGQKIVDGGAATTGVGLSTGSAREPLIGWGLSVFARGQCQITGRASGLECTNGLLLDQFSAQAPAVGGRRAYWAGPSLVWQYARGGWASLTAPTSSYRTLQQDKVMRAETLRIARHVQLGVATPPLVFPAQLTGLTSQWRISDLSYSPVAGMLGAGTFMLTTGASRFLPHAGDLGLWANAPYFDIHPSPRGGTCTPHDPASNNTSEVINGYQVVVKRFTADGLPEQELCAADADGLWLSIIEYGPHPTIGVVSLFKDHLRLLGTNPSHWTRHPIH